MTTASRVIFLFLWIWFPEGLIAQGQKTQHLELPLIQSGEDIIRHTGYTFSYQEKYEQASWVAYQLTAEETAKAFERTNKFIPDPLVKTGSATDADYAGAGYDRGHLAPAADMGWSEITMKESFYFSNMSPQTPSFNRGIWKKLEEMVRSWALEYDSIYIVTGPVFEGEMKTIGSNKVAVPPYYYKVILRKDEKGYHSIGFLLPNEASSLPLDEFAVSVDSVEKRTHINFFAALDDALEEKTEHERCLPCWSWKISKQTSTVKKVHREVQEKEEEKMSSSAVMHLDESVQCHGTTQKGTRCKKKTKDPSGFCNIHQKMH